MSSLACNQHSDRRAGPVTTVGGHSSAQTFIASGQRGWNRQAAGGLTRFGGAPGIECSFVVESEIVEFSSSREYGCDGLVVTS